MPAAEGERWHQHPWRRREMREAALGTAIAMSFAIIIGIPAAFIAWAASIGGR